MFIAVNASFFIPSEVAHLPQYATLFVAGLFAARYEWFDRFSRRSGRRWLVVGVGGGVLTLRALSVVVSTAVDRRYQLRRL